MYLSSAADKSKYTDSISEDFPRIQKYLGKGCLFLSYDSRLNFEKGKSIIPMVMTAQLDAH